MLRFGIVLDCDDRAGIVDTIIDRELNELKYQRVSDWFTYFEKLARPGCPSPEEVARIAECKASRDVLAHSKGIVNSVYMTKSGRYARYEIGKLVEIPDDYHRETWLLLKKVIGDLAAAVIPKLPPS